ncbi:substrate-binding domain-containing protein [Paraburkholderia unamae]|uniref:LacI family transcriptional regulator n=1 Tax=Paraburkholderia unamae TaxID=219649 RepID=A0ABX5KMX2_9BURK|nr:substrate-binding domain-containing protein [Paraburkholderia unamae]PVX79863.1 LacI family transcriptional regulator [Paraburkholderia unamae]
MRNFPGRVPRLSDLVLAIIYEGIDDAADAAGYMTFVANTHDDAQRQRLLGEAALHRNVEGLIFADARRDETAFIDELAKRGVPMILVSRHQGRKYCSITCDDLAGGKMAADHLVALGHRDFAVLAGEQYSSSGWDRCVGFVERCKALGVEIRPDSILHGPFDTAAGREAGEQLCARKRKPTAIFAVNDFLAIGVMGALRDSGMQPGRDVALVGFNDTPLAAQLPIGLTSVRSPMHPMGFRAMELLVKQLGGEKPKSERLRPELIVRMSSGGPIG